MTMRRVFPLLLACAALSCVSPELQAVKIIAHRGASWDAPENTVPSVELGFERGADAVEIDVYLSADGRVVAIHDADTKRVTGVRLEVEQSTVAELQKLDAGSWKGAQWAGTTIPTLEEVLDAVPDRGRLVIEIKGGEEVVPAVEAVLDASGKRRQAMIIAFSYPVIRAAKQRMPDVPSFWLYGFSRREAKAWGNPSLEDLLAKAVDAQLDGLNLRADGPFDKAFVDSVHAAGMRLLVWTENDPASARRLVEQGVDAITTDRPAFLRRELGL